MSISLSYVDMPPDHPVIEGSVSLGSAPSDPLTVQRRLSGSQWEDVLVVDPPMQNFGFDDPEVLFNKPVQYRVVENGSAVDGPETIETALLVECSGSGHAHTHDAEVPS